MVTTSRRDVMRMTLGVSVLGSPLGLAACAPAAKDKARPGIRTLYFAQANEPVSLNTAITSAGPVTFTASKIFDGLLTYDLDGKPQPQLATAWSVSDDGLTYRFDLRPNVRWHDGKPFTSADVAFSLQKVWREYHGRGRTTYANVVSVEASDPLMSVWHLSKPAPYLLSCLAASESTVIPSHLYEGSDILTNPRNLTPVGTGPFRFASWARGNQIVLERNPDYWDQPKPYLDRIVVRFLPDATAAAIALETGTIDLTSGVPFSEVPRLGANKALSLVTEEKSYSPNWTQFEFNLERPALKDVRVRQAIAHAIDRDFIAKNILGNAEVADSPVPKELNEFHADGLPAYPFDLASANALLDEAGVKPDAAGVRLKLFFDFTGSPSAVRMAANMRSTLAKVGISLQARSQDQGEYINRIYTRGDFDTCMTGSGAGRDPAIGVQRYYWSKNIKTGVAFSNGPHYRNPEVDRILETAQVERDPVKRRKLYADFQHIVMTDLPYLPLFWTHAYIGANRRVTGLLTTLSGLNSNFADVKLTA